MKTIYIVFCWCLSSVYGGVIPWSPEGEQEARDLYLQYCRSQGDQGADQNRDLDWYCKRSPNAGRVHTFPHRHNLTPVQSSRKQLVFIETPGDHYRHEILVTGSVEGKHKTNIVVIPGNDEHNVVVKDDVAVNLKAEKPSTFFLKRNPNAGGRDLSQNAQQLSSAENVGRGVTLKRVETRKSQAHNEELEPKKGSFSLFDV